MTTLAVSRELSGISDSIFDQLVADIAGRLGEIKSVLEIGPGRGKYADLLRRAGVKAKLSAIETSEEYVDAFGLRQKYDEVMVLDASRLADNAAFFNRTYDLVIIGDCIEHMPKSRGLDVLNFLRHHLPFTRRHSRYCVWHERPQEVVAQSSRCVDCRTGEPCKPGCG